MAKKDRKVTVEESKKGWEKLTPERQKEIEQLRQEEAGNEYIREREKLASLQGISSQKAAKEMVPGEATKMQPIIEKMITKAAEEKVAGMELKNQEKLDQELTNQKIEEENYKKSPIGMFEGMITGDTLKEAAEKQGGRLSTGIVPLVPAGFMAGGAGFILKGGARGSTGIGMAKIGTARSIIKTSSLINKITGISLIGLIAKEPIQEFMGSISGTTDIDIALTSSANDMTDITTEMTMGLPADEALMQLNDIETNINEINKSLQNMNMISEIFYKKKGRSQQKDTLNLQKRLKIMRFQIIRNQMLGRKPNEPI